MERMLGWGQAGPMRGRLGSTYCRFIMCLKLCIVHQVILNKTNMKKPLFCIMPCKK